LGELGRRVNAIRAVSVLPIAVGFGISSAARAAAVGRIADGVVVGSALVSRMQAGGAAAALAFTRELRAALDGAAVTA
jgi:tryptophan synthase alpha chain